MPDDVTLSTGDDPLSSLSGKKIILTPAQLRRAGAIIIKAIQEEIRADTAKAAAVRKRGQPAPIPKTADFAKSFKFRVQGRNTLIITSDWPTARNHTTTPLDPERKTPGPAEPFEMRWLTRKKVPAARIVLQDGEVIVRATPDLLAGGKYWIHPGFRKYLFLERGLRRGQKAALAALIPELLQGLLAGELDLFR